MLQELRAYESTERYVYAPKVNLNVTLYVMKINDIQNENGKVGSPGPDYS